MSNMYTCITYLIEIQKFCSKNLVYKRVNFVAQNALKLTYKHLYFPKISRGYTPVIRGGGKGGEAPQFTFLATPLSTFP